MGKYTLRYADGRIFGWLDDKARAIRFAKANDLRVTTVLFDQVFDVTDDC